MEIKELQDYILKRDNCKDFPSEAMLKLMEEVGELANEVRIVQLKKDHPERFSGYDEAKALKNMATEVYDVIHYALAVANAYNIDATKAIEAKIEKNKNRTWNKK